VLELTERQVVGRGDDARARAARERVDRALFARRDAGDRAARDALVERFLPLARSLARRYESSDEPMDDLVQVASVALVKAVDRFDPEQGSAFSSFAVPTIVGELKRYFRDRTWMVRPPRSLQELTLRVQAAITALTRQLDRAPTVSELATSLHCDEEQILEALQARSGRSALSLQAPSATDDGQHALQDTLGCREEGFALAESRVILDELIATLSPRSRKVLRLRFEQDLTQAEIGERLGVSQMQISRLIRESLQTLRETAEREPLSAAASGV
jgi:RNA polymerase sigma-B factor